MYSWSADLGCHVKLNSWTCVIIIDVRLVHIQEGVLHLLTGLACKSARKITFLSKFPMKVSWNKILISSCPRQFVLPKSCWVSAPKCLHCSRLLVYYFVCSPLLLDGKCSFSLASSNLKWWTPWFFQTWDFLLGYTALDKYFKQKSVLCWPQLRRQEEVPLVEHYITIPALRRMCMPCLLSLNFFHKVNWRQQLGCCPLVTLICLLCRMVLPCVP